MDELVFFGAFSAGRLCVMFPFLSLKQQHKGILNNYRQKWTFDNYESLNCNRHTFIKTLPLPPIATLAHSLIIT